MAALLVFFLCSALGAYLCTGLFSPQFFWHLTVGRWIRAHQALPTVDLWTLAGLNHTWKTPSWLFEYLLAVIDGVGGEKALAVFKVSLFCLYVLTLSFVLSRAAGDRFIGTLLGFLCACGTLADSPFEPSVFGWVLFLLLLDCAALWLKKDGRRRVLVSAFCLAVLYANIHPSLVFALLCSSIIILSPRAIEERDNHWTNVLFPFVLIVSLFCTPYWGTELLGSLVGFFREARINCVLQLNPADVYDYSFSFLLVSWLILAVLWKESQQALSAPEVLLLVVASLAGMADKAMIPYALLLVSFFSARTWAAGERGTFGRFGEGLERLRAHLVKYPPEGVLWIALVVVIINVAPLMKMPVLRAALPERELDYVLRQNLPFPLLHDSFIGPYVIFRLSDAEGNPRKLAAVDSRVRQLSPQLAWQEAKLAELGPGWREFRNFVSPKTVLCRSSQALCQALLRDPQWRLALSGGRVVSSSDKGAVGQNDLPGWLVLERIRPFESADML